MEEDPGIDFHKLEKELASAVEADAKYQRENAAKFRAVKQRVGSYEEFKDIVAASHLKPLEKNDRIAQEKIKQPWNVLSTKTALAIEKSDSTNATNISSKSSKIPQTHHEFSKTWKHQLKTKEERYHYLCDIGGEQLGKIFKAEISMGLLGEFIEVLQNCWHSSDCEVIFNILQHFSMTNRFSLSLEFLSANERSYINELFQRVEATFLENEAKLSMDKLEELRKIYKVPK